MTPGSQNQPPTESDPRERVRRLLGRARSRAALPWLAAILVALVSVIAAGREFETHLRAIESGIAALGPWTWIAFVALFVVTSSLLLPDSILCVIAGALFTYPSGLAAVAAGALLAAAVQYGLASGVLRTRVERMLTARPSLAAIRRAIARDEFRLQLLVRLTPLNPATFSYLLGAAGVRFPGFIAACLALIPTHAVAVYSGHAVSHAARFTVGGSRTSPLHHLAVLGALAAGIVVLFLVSRMARRAVMEAASEASPPQPPSENPRSDG